MKKIKFTYKTVVKITALTTLSLLLNCATKNSFMSVPLFLSTLYLGFNPLLSAVAFTLSFAIIFNLKYLFCSAVTAVLLCPAFAVLRKKKKGVGAKIIPLSIIAVIPFTIIGQAITVEAFLQGGLSVLLTLVFISSSRVIFIKNFNYKCAVEEIVCLSVFTFIIGVGFINLFGFNAYRAVAIFIILSCSLIFSKGVSVAISTVLAFAPTFLSFSYSFFMALPTLALVCALFSSRSKFLVALTGILFDLFTVAVLKVYGEFYYTDALYSVFASCAFLFLPTKLYSHLKTKVLSLNENTLSKHAVNRTRLALSQKLYELAGVFSQMKSGFESLKREEISTDKLCSNLADEIIMNVCESCPSFPSCKQKNLPDTEELKNIISVGVAKGRISLIDLTKNFVSKCSYCNSVISEVNSLIARYKDKTRKSEEIENGKELITMQAGGVSSVLKSLALDYSKSLTVDGKIEKTVGEALRKNGVTYREIMALQNDFSIEIILTLDCGGLDGSKIERIVSNSLGQKMNVCYKTALSLNTCSLSLRPAPVLDASFGLSSTKKFGSTASGDTHSLLKIDEGKFIVCLSDGMGSGEQALKTSGTAVSLIESFYKAGIDGESVLGMVNKILTIGAEESFSAIDILTVNLFNLSCDFVKIGSPSSYLITDKSIRIIEGNTLPLGILDDLKPTAVSLPLTEGATVLMVTDGISDAFGSSTDIISYLKTLKSLNPQKLADDVLNYALKQENGKPKDDMTAVCIRIFKKAS